MLVRTVFKMYIKEGCPFCDKAAEKVTKDLGFSLHTIDVTNDPQLHQKIIAETGHKTVPAIWACGEFIGGCDDLFNICEQSDFELKLLREEVSILRSEVNRLKRSLW